MFLRRRSSGFAWASLDLATSLLAVIIVLISPAKAKTPPHIETFGTYAIVLEWSGDNRDDVDLWVRNPKGAIVFFGNTSGGFMNLEHDDIPDVTEGSSAFASGNHERIVIRSTIPGEYTANVHMYRKQSVGPVKVEVTLWRLKGEDEVVRRQELTLHRSGDEQTAFRFTINQQGNTSNFNRLPRKFVAGSDHLESPPLPSSPPPLGGRRF